MTITSLCWTCVVIITLSIVGVWLLSPKPPVKSTPTEADTNKVSFWKRDSWKTMKRVAKWIVLILIVTVGVYMAHRNHTYSKVIGHFNKPVYVEDVWRMRWNYQGQEYNLKVVMTRKDENHLEMTAFGNYPSKIKMLRQPATSEYKWIGEFRNPPYPGGFMKLNEKIVLGEVVYEGIQMGRDDPDWITATIEKAW